MDPLMVLMMSILSKYCLEVHWDLPMVMFLAAIKASKRNYQVVKCLVPHLEM